MQILKFATLLFLLANFQAFSQCGACKKQVELIPNGNFSNGNTGFSTTLTPASGFICPLCPEGTYVVGTNAFFYHNQFAGLDHTNPGNGSYMIVNGTGAANVVVWCATVPVQQNTDYTFSFWGRDVATNSNLHPLARLQASFNGEHLGDTLICSGGWQNETFLWNSGDTSLVQICLINYQDQTGGNDFGIDDISLSGCEDIHLQYPAQAGNDTITFCAGSSANLGAAQHAGYSYVWTPQTGLSNPYAANPVLNLSNSSDTVFTTTYYLTSDSSGVGCLTRDSIKVQVLPFYPLNVPDYVSFCPGLTYTIQPPQQYDQYIWDGVVGNSTLDVQTAGIYHLTVHAGNCSASDSITIEIPDMPSLAGILPEYRLCEGDTLFVAAPAPGIWSTGVFGDSLGIVSAGNYTYTYQFATCRDSARFNVFLDAMPTLTVSGANTLCEGAAADLLSSSVATWNTGVTSDRITIDQAGVYWAQLASGACTAVDSVEVMSSPLPVVNLPNDTLICDLYPLLLNAASESNISYLWSTGDTTASLVIDTAGVYTVEVSNFCGTASDEIVVDSWDCLFGLYAPNAFTPDDNGINDVWEVRGYNIQKVKIYVYNRLGNLVFQTNKLNEPWRPDPQNIGTDIYNFRITAESPTGEAITETGFILKLE
jgi:gliding motility-associated-like protein